MVIKVIKSMVIYVESFQSDERQINDFIYRYLSTYFERWNGI